MVQQLKAVSLQQFKQMAKSPFYLLSINNTGSVVLDKELNSFFINDLVSNTSSGSGAGVAVQAISGSSISNTQAVAITGSIINFNNTIWPISGSSASNTFPINITGSVGNLNNTIWPITGSTIGLPVQMQFVTGSVIVPNNFTIATGSKTVAPAASAILGNLITGTAGTYSIRAWAGTGLGTPVAGDEANIQLLKSGSLITVIPYLAGTMNQFGPYVLTVGPSESISGSAVLAGTAGVSYLFGLSATRLF